MVILSRSGTEAKNPYEEANKGRVSGILRRYAPQNDIPMPLQNHLFGLNVHKNTSYPNLYLKVRSIGLIHVNILILNGILIPYETRVKWVYSI